MTLRFEIRDTGIGIPADRLTVLFSPFVQADGSTTRKYSGTGLGLSISKQLSELMGRCIGARSQEGSGATFWFTAIFEKQKPTANKTPMLPAKLQGTKVLIVDHHKAGRLSLTAILESWGCTCTAETDGQSALCELDDAVQNNAPYEIALLSIPMPGMDDEMLCRRIKADVRLNQTKLIMITSLGQRGDAKRLKQIGFCGYLNKPIHRTQLRDCLALAFGLKKENKKTRRDPLSPAIPLPSLKNSRF